MLNAGRPILVEWDNKERGLIDGFGLCSPSRWPPSAGGAKRTLEMLELASKTYSLLRKFVLENLRDPRREAFRLATGKIDGSPFSPCAMADLRAQWARLLPDPDAALVVDDGVPIGVDEPLPRTPQVFPLKEKHRKLDDSEFNPIATNYASAQLSTAELEAKFWEEEQLGRMFPTKLPVLVQQLGEERVRVAAMAAIIKPDGSVRPLHDGTHSVQVNNSIKYRDQIQCPGSPEVAAMVRESCETREASFCISADIKSAHH